MSSQSTFTVPASITELSYAAIRQMPASRATDELVARFVLGWKRGEPGTDDATWLSPIISDDLSASRDMSAKRWRVELYLHNISTTIYFAIAAANRMSESGSMCDGWTLRRIRDTFMASIEVGFAGEHETEAEAPTPELALCRAMLRAAKWRAEHPAAGGSSASEAGGGYSGRKIPLEIFETKVGTRRGDEYAGQPTDAGQPSSVPVTDGIGGPVIGDAKNIRRDAKGNIVANIELANPPTVPNMLRAVKDVAENLPAETSKKGD